MRKIYFPVEHDADGYPPVAGETMWATALGQGLYRLENIPFFAKGVSLGDEVAADLVDGTPTFTRVVNRAGHCTIRVAVEDPQDVSNVRQQLLELGSSTELSHLPRLVSVDVAPEVNRAGILSFLQSARDVGRLDFEVADMAQSELDGD